MNAFLLPAVSYIATERSDSQGTNLNIFFRKSWSRMFAVGRYKLLLKSKTTERSNANRTQPNFP